MDLVPLTTGRRPGFLKMESNARTSFLSPTGVAVAWGEPSDRDLRDQFMVEGFYRLQLTPAIQLTPDVQFIINPSNAPSEDHVWVVGVRLRISI